MPRINKTRYAALGFLMMEPMSGYDIKKFMKRTTSYFWMESDGQLYPILHKLVAEGLVTSEQNDTGARKKMLYSITQKGRDEFEKWMTQSPDQPIKRYELSLKVFFGSFVDVDIVIEHILSDLENANEQLELFKQLNEQLEVEFGQSPAYRYWKLLLLKGDMANKAFIDWANKALPELKSMKLKK